RAIYTAPPHLAAAARGFAAFPAPLWLRHGLQNHPARPAFGGVPVLLPVRLLRWHGAEWWADRRRSRQPVRRGADRGAPQHRDDLGADPLSAGGVDGFRRSRNTGFNELQRVGAAGAEPATLPA